MDTLGWDCPAPNDDEGEHGLSAEDHEYDLWALNCCVVRDAYCRGDAVLWNRVLAYWDKMLSH